MEIKIKLKARPAKRDYLFEANISANKISLPQGQSYTEREYYEGPQSKAFFANTDLFAGI